MVVLLVQRLILRYTCGGGVVGSEVNTSVYMRWWVLLVQRLILRYTCGGGVVGSEANTSVYMRWWCCWFRG